MASLTIAIMKKTILLITCVCLLAGSLSSCWRNSMDDDNLSIAVTDSDDYYKIKAEFAEDKTRKVQKYLNKNFSPNEIFASEDDHMDITTKLWGDTWIYIKSSPGKLILRLDKDKNSKESYRRVKEVAEGLKEQLTD